MEPPTPFEVSDRLVDDVTRLDPILATAAGVAGHDHEWTDLSPGGHDHRAEVLRGHRRSLLPGLRHPERHQRMAARVLVGWIDEGLEAHKAGDHLRDVSHMGCSFESMREALDLQDRSSEEGLEAVQARLSAVGSLLEGLWGEPRARPRPGDGTVPAPGDVGDRAGGGAGRSHFPMGAIRLRGGGGDPRVRGEDGGGGRSGPGGGRPVRPAPPGGLPPPGDGPRRGRAGALSAGSGSSSGAGARSAGDLRVGVGGDPPAQIRAGRGGKGGRPGYGVGRGGDPASGDRSAAAVTSPEALVSFVVERQRAALDALAGSHFEVPDEIRRVEVQLAPPGGALGAYYHQPSEDFSRPGTIWYSLADQPLFPLYQEASTAYHEGFPGHHLQIGTSAVMSDRLSRAHRLLIWYAGSGEGWGLYAERLMGELGFFERPDYVFGMLVSHLFRAARVVADIGLHLGLRLPDSAPIHRGQPWDFDRAVDVVHRIGMQPVPYAVSEVTRYLGWPGQAISYKVGERTILSLREETRRRKGDHFSLDQFHARILQDGAIRLDLLHDLLAEQ